MQATNTAVVIINRNQETIHIGSEQTFVPAVDLDHLRINISRHIVRHIRGYVNSSVVHSGVHITRASILIALSGVAVVDVRLQESIRSTNNKHHHSHLPGHTVLMSVVR